MVWHLERNKMKEKKTENRISHRQLHLRENDYHVATGQCYIPKFEEGGAATFFSTDCQHALGCYSHRLTWVSSKSTLR